MRSVLAKCLFVGLLVFSGAALAEPWCLVRDAQENCRFSTADDCYTQANRAGGYCKPNPRELGVRGNAPYCVITAGNKVCTYRSRGRCLTVARQKSGGCVRNTELDLARRAMGEQRVLGCNATDPDCAVSYEEFAESGLEAAGYAPEVEPAPDLELEP